MKHIERQSRLTSARTTLIDALRLCDQGMVDEAFVGCAMAMVFLGPVTNEDRVGVLTRGMLERSVERTKGSR